MPSARSDFLAFRWPIGVAGFLIFAVVVWLGFLIQVGLLTNKDEFCTAERSREMLLRGRDAVRENFAISVIKPPLQYWLTTLTLPHFAKRETAVRVWPLLYGTLTALALGWLTFVLDPRRPWMIPLAIGALLTCPLFVPEICRGMLDAGLTFFTTLAIVFAQLARRHPAWWLGVALACWLGALQKIPLILLVWGIIVLVRACTPSGRRTLHAGWLAASLVVALAGISIWPWLQMSHHQDWTSVFRFREAMDLTGSARLGAKPYLEVPFRLVTTWPCGFFAIWAALAVQRGRSLTSNPGFREISAVSLALVGLAVIFNFRSARYLVPIIPSLCLLLALLLHHLWDERRRAAKILLVAVALLALLGLEVTRQIIDYRRKDHSAQLPLAEKLGSLQTPGATIVILEPDVGVLPEQFYLFYANLQFPVQTWSVADLRRLHPSTPAIGVCNQHDLAAVSQIYPNLSIEMRRGEFFCWRAPAL